MTIRVTSLDSIIHFGRYRGRMKTFRQLLLRDKLEDQNYVVWLDREKVLDVTTGEDTDYFNKAVAVAQIAVDAARLEVNRLRRKLRRRRAVSVLFGGFDEFDCIRDASDAVGMHRIDMDDIIDSDDSGNVYPSERSRREDHERELRSQIEREVESDFNRRHGLGFRGTGWDNHGDDAIPPGFSGGM